MSLDIRQNIDNSDFWENGNQPNEPHQPSCPPGVSFQASVQLWRGERGQGGRVVSTRGEDSSPEELKTTRNFTGGNRYELHKGQVWSHVRSCVHPRCVYTCVRKLPEPGRGRAESSMQNAERCHLAYRKTSPSLRLTRFYPAKFKKQNLEGLVSSNTWQTKTLKTF